MQDHEQRYRAHRARIIERIRAERGIQGGQGRSAQSLRKDATGCAFGAALVVLLVVLAVARACAGGES